MERLIVVPLFLAKHSSTAARQFENIQVSVASVSKEGIGQTSWSWRKP